MKVVTYQGKKWYHVKTKYSGIYVKTQYFVDIEPISKKQEDREYYVYPIIDRDGSCIIYEILLLSICSFGFVFSCLGKALFFLLTGQIKPIFDINTYAQTLYGDDIPLIDAINTIKAINNRGWRQWYEVQSDCLLTYKELRKIIRRNQDYENIVITVKNKTVQNRPVDS